MHLLRLMCSKSNYAYTSYVTAPHCKTFGALMCNVHQINIITIKRSVMLVIIITLFVCVCVTLNNVYTSLTTATYCRSLWYTHVQCAPLIYASLFCVIYHQSSFTLRRPCYFELLFFFF